MNDASDSPLRARRSGVQSIETGGDLLEAMVRLNVPASLSDIARVSGLPPAKAHRYLASLCEIGLTMQHAGSGLYALGPLALRMGLVAIKQHDIIERAYELLATLCNRLNTSGHLSVWSDIGPVVIRSAHGGPPVISPVAVGTLLPLKRSASGLVFLSFMPATATERAAQAQGPDTGWNEIPLETLREKTISAGYALASGQYIAGLSAISLPIFNHDKTLAAAITVVSTDTKVFVENSNATRAAAEGAQALHRQWTVTGWPAQPFE